MVKIAGSGYFGRTYHIVIIALLEHIMKKEFPGYFSGATADLERIWGECLFVLDANVLLNLYRYSDFTCRELLEVFGSLSERLWVPHQVVYEYLNNRLNVIGEVVKVYDDAVKKIDALQKSLENHNQHPFVATKTLADSLRVFGRVVAELGENRKVHERRISSDEIKDRLVTLLEGKVGDGFSQEQLEKIILEGKARYEQKTPPGYCDAKKGGDSNVFSDICKPYGDYIVWLQIIEKARSLGKSVVFVTGDTKDDWWASFQGKTLGPHPQLVQEFLTLVGRDFYMYPPDRFLTKASEYLKKDASEQAVKEIRDIREDDLQNEQSKIGLSNSYVTSLDFQAGSHEYDKYTKERESINRHGIRVYDRLSNLRKKRDALQEYHRSLLDEDTGADDVDVTRTDNQILELDMVIRSLEQELTAMRDAMSAVIAKQRSLRLADNMLNR